MGGHGCRRDEGTCLRGRGYEAGMQAQVQKGWFERHPYANSLPTEGPTHLPRDPDAFFSANQTQKGGA